MDNTEYFNGVIVGDKYKSGLTFNFTVAVPKEKRKKYALLLDHDGINEVHVSAMRKLAQEGKAPYCVCVGVMPGYIEKNGENVRGMRFNSYDLFTSEYGDFIVYELIPYIEKEYGIKFYDEPDMRCVSGGSSGGISAFSIAWFHPESFRRVYMSSPSFLAMGRGNEIPYLIRKYETKPLRIYEEYSENEPNDYFGASYPIDIEAKRALEFAGYDFACEYFPNEGHCSRIKNAESAYKRLEWLWRNYDSEKIRPLRNSPRVDRIVEFGNEWEKVDVFPKDIKANEEIQIVSNDEEMIYVSNKNDDAIYAYRNAEQKGKRFVYALLHTLPAVKPIGVIDMAVDKSDRIYALTAIGVQCIRSFGIVDAVLDLPLGQPLAVVVTDALYVKTDKGAYRRKLKKECLDDSEVKRKHVEYYD